MSRIGEVFARARAQQRPAYIPYITAGDPSPELTPPMCEALARAGADLIELGVPFSDPLADGPTIQRACERALSHGVGLASALRIATEVRRRAATALVLFTYYNPIHRMGEEAFAVAAAGAGVDGVLVTDLPLEEGGPLRERLIARGVDPILLVAPTTGAARLAASAREARGFLYYISRTGVTGARSDLPEGLAREVATVRAAASLPVAVGFGVADPAQVRAVGALAEGVVVGSALVAEIERAVAEGAAAEAPARLERAAARLFGRGPSRSGGER